MSAAFGWALAVLAVGWGYASWGWRGAALSLTVVVFWLLLQFSRSLRALQRAAGGPVGQVESAVMLHARLARGMRLPDVLKLTRSLGRRIDAAPETWAWSDAAGDEVRVVLDRGRVSRWTLERAAPAQTTAAS